LHLSDLLSLSPTAGNTSPWLSKDDAIFKAGSKRLGTYISSIIDLIPFEWSKIVSKRIKEALCVGDWIIRKNELVGMPYFVFVVLEVSSNKILCASQSLRT
jgi:hypothetical protein